MKDKTNKKRSVGRPKLADTKLKKTSIIMCIICTVIIIALLIVGAYKLDIIKLKGNVSNNYDIGDEFCLNTECFITIRDKGDSVVALSKYNLLVGNVYNANDNSLTEILESTDGYGLQSEEAKGYVEDSDEYVGVVGFLDDKVGIYYWDEQNYVVKNGYKEEVSFVSGTSTQHISYIYDSNAIFSKYVDNYKDRLNEMGFDFNIRLINYNDLFYLNQGVDVSNEAFANYIEGGGKQKANLDKDFSFLRNSSYWLGYALSVKEGSQGGVLRPSTAKFGIADPELIYNDYYNNTLYGVRPVIEINKEQIPDNRGFNDDNYVKGQKVELAGESFNVIKQEDDTVKLLPKYNLYVGEIFDDVDDTHTPITESDPGYGIQNSNAKGFIDDEYQKDVGVVDFAIKKNGEQYYYWQDSDGNFDNSYLKSVTMFGDTTEYGYVYNSNSEVYKYVNNYVNYLKKNTNMNSIEGTLLDYQDIIDLFININTGGLEIPSWYSKGNYWTAGLVLDPEEATSIAMVIDNSNVVDAYNIEEENTRAGVRPLITVSKDDLKKLNTTTTTTTKKQEIKRGTTKKVTTVKASRTSFKSIMNNNTETSKVSTTVNKIKTTKAKNFVNKVNISNEKSNCSFWILICINIILLIIIIIEIILLNKKKKANN